MTEAEWLAATEPDPMLGLLRGKATARKLRLFACACCREFAHLLAPSLLESLAAAERVAEGVAGPGDRKRAKGAALHSGLSVAPRVVRPARLKQAVISALEENADQAALRASRSAAMCFTASIWPLEMLSDPAVERHRCAQVATLRDIFANPFQSAPTVAPMWLAWHGGTVAQLAQVAYNERRLPEGTLDPARLAVLADALEDAGCTDAELLGHLRGPGPHVRGCWALDRILARE
jgi:hypothetical protein